jgi:hypothetical protein
MQPGLEGLLVAGSLLGLAAARVRAWSGLRSALAVLAAGAPRRFRALVRLRARSVWRPTRSWLALYEATGLFWAGAFERAIATAHRSGGAPDGRLKTLLLALEVESLIFSDRLAEARQLFELHEELLASLAPNAFGIADGATLDAVLRFHAGELDSSWERLDALRGATGGRTAASRVIQFYLAAIAHKRGRHDEARLHLEATIREGGDLFIARWATQTHEEIFAGEPLPASAGATVSVASTPLWFPYSEENSSNATKPSSPHSSSTKRTRSTTRRHSSRLVARASMTCIS